MNKQLIKGTIVGIIAPIAAFVVYVAFFTEDSDPVGMYNHRGLDQLSNYCYL